MLAALATEGPNLKYSVQLALCHLLFNFAGILLFYPIPYMRFPIPMAQKLGSITAKYKWFAVFYLIGMFLLLPLFVFTLSLLGPIAFYSVIIPVGIIIILVLIRNIIKYFQPNLLPEKYRTWDFLPIYLHSLEPYDKLVNQTMNWCTQVCCNKEGLKENSNETQHLQPKATTTNYNSHAATGLTNRAFKAEILDSETKQQSSM